MHAQYLSKLDLSHDQAYHQLELEEQSRYITTFSTHLGLYRYKSLNYGTNAAAEMFQYTLQTALQGLTGVKNIADDIIMLPQQELLLLLEILYVPQRAFRHTITMRNLKKNYAILFKI